MIKPCHASIKKIAKDHRVTATVAKFLSSTQYLSVFARHISEAYKQCEAILDDLPLVGAGRSERCLQTADRSIVGQWCLASNVLGERDFDVSTVLLARPAIHEPLRLKPVNDPGNRAMAQLKLATQLAKRRCTLGSK